MTKTREPFVPWGNTKIKVILSYSVLFSFKKRNFHEEQLDYLEHDHLLLIDYLSNKEILIILDRLGMFPNQWINIPRLTALMTWISRFAAIAAISNHHSFFNNASMAATI